MKIHTLRGRIEEGQLKQLIVDDGRLSHGLKVVKFIVAPEMTASSQGVNAVLGLDDKITADWDWENGNQIAWATSSMSGSSNMEAPGFQLVDPNHIVIRDLYIRGTVTGSTPQALNYYVELEAISISEFEAIVQLTKETSQS